MAEEKNISILKRLEALEERLDELEKKVETLSDNDIELARTLGVLKEEPKPEPKEE